MASLTTTEVLGFCTSVGQAMTTHKGPAADQETGRRRLADGTGRRAANRRRGGLGAGATQDRLEAANRGHRRRAGCRLRQRLDQAGHHDRRGGQDLRTGQATGQVAQRHPPGAESPARPAHSESLTPWSRAGYAVRPPPLPGGRPPLVKRRLAFDERGMPFCYGRPTF